MHIGGETRSGGGGDLALAEPATGEPLATVARAGEANVDAAVAAAGAALHGDWARAPATGAVAPHARASPTGSGRAGRS